VRAAGCRQPQSAGPGAIVAMLSLFADADLGLGAEARRASEVMLVRRTVFRRLLEEYPEAAAALHARLSQELVRLGGEVSGVRESLDAVAAPSGEA